LQAPSPGENDKRPVPDPTSLTTAALYREISQLRESMEHLIQALRELVEHEIHALEKLTYARFDRIDQQLGSAERLRIEQKVDTKVAVDAALTSAKELVAQQTAAQQEAIAKSEAATSKQLEQLSATFTTAIGGASDTISDLKERVGRIESVKVGGQEKTAAIYAFAAFVLVLLTIFGFVAAFHK